MLLFFARHPSECVIRLLVSVASQHGAEAHAASGVCMRSALFPVPLAFESTGIIAALIAMIIVALATIYTVELLMAQATATGMHDYSTLSTAVGGRWYKVCASIYWEHQRCRNGRQVLLLMHAAWRSTRG